MRAQQWEENAPAQESVELPGVLKEMQVGRWWGMVGRGPGGSFGQPYQMCHSEGSLLLPGQVARA